MIRALVVGGGSPTSGTWRPPLSDVKTTSVSSAIPAASVRAVVVHSTVKGVAPAISAERLGLWPNPPLLSRTVACATGAPWASVTEMRVRVAGIDCDMRARCCVAPRVFGRGVCE